MSQPTRTRRVRVIDRPIQHALLSRIVLHWVSLIAVSFCVLLALEYMAAPPAQSLTTLLGVFWGKYALMYCLMASLLPMFAYDSLKLSNRFAGPMVRVRQGLEGLSRGEPVEPLAFRDGDFWSELSASFNILRDRLARRDDT